MLEVRELMRGKDKRRLPVVDDINRCLLYTSLNETNEGELKMKKMSKVLTALVLGTLLTGALAGLSLIHIWVQNVVRQFGPYPSRA